MADGWQVARGFFRRESRAFGVVVFGVLLAAGCQQPPVIPVDDNAEVEPNGSFATARTATLAIDDSAVLTGTIDAAGDVDVFNLGLVARGDAVDVEMSRPSGNLEGALALYDIEDELIREDTLSSVDLGTDPRILHTVRSDSASVFIAVSHSPVRPSTGAYELHVRIMRGGQALAPQRQVVLLNFAGGQANDPIFGQIAVGPFDAGAISLDYANDTEFFKSVIVETALANYTRFDIVFVTSDDSEAPQEPYAEVLFGGFNGFAFGASEEVDPYNANPQGRAVIFTESFEPDLFARNPSAAQLAVAIGNVASHELGHLLGLNHVTDPTALMDEASPAFTLLADQEFKSAPLSESIFPLGRHDSADLLFVTLGSAAPAAKLYEWRARGMPQPVESSGPPRRAFGAQGAPLGKCLNCMIREGRAGRGPLRHMWLPAPSTQVP